MGKFTSTRGCMFAAGVHNCLTWMSMRVPVKKKKSNILAEPTIYNALLPANFVLEVRNMMSFGLLKHPFFYEALLLCTDTEMVKSFCSSHFPKKHAAH